ncbi:MAG: hypothetical protein QNJ64_01750 [Crocosphaera sp.]|nr:hypothetical protein [Crocosphaera sp.]
MRAVNIGLFNQFSFTTPDETNNLIEVLELENIVTEFSGLEPQTWQEIANQNQVIAIPSIEGQSLFQALSEPTRNVIRDYVSNGGGLFTLGEPTTAIELLNGLFGFSLTTNFFGGSLFLNTINAEGTIFQLGPPNVPAVAFFSPLSISSLPEGSISFYDNLSNSIEQDSTGVLISPFGEGLIGYNGFNYTTAPSQAGGWPEATNLTVEFIATDESESISESSSLLGILVIGGYLIYKNFSAKAQ